jgi:DNA-directed RNA polymerase subunit M/transcription elongation factor TFIIS
MTTHDTVSKRVECDRCGKKVRLHNDGTLPKHEYTSFQYDSRHRIAAGSRTRRECEHSGKRYAFHLGTFFVSARSADGMATTWTAHCRCGESWTGATHDEVEALWGNHCRAVDPMPIGEVANRG